MWIKVGDKLKAKSTIRYCMGQISSDKIKRNEVVTVESINEEKGTFTCLEHADRYGPWYITDFTKVKNVDLKLLAKKFYFELVKVEEYRNNFVEKLKTYTVTDKRKEGYHCGYCNDFSKKPMAFECKNQTIFPANNKNEIWIVNRHYDGCRGWD